MTWHGSTPIMSDSVVVGQVSVDLQKLKSMLDSSASRYGFIQSMESVYNSLGQMATTPLIIELDDLVATCRILTTSQCTQEQGQDQRLVRHQQGGW